MYLLKGRVIERGGDSDGSSAHWLMHLVTVMAMGGLDPGQKPEASYLSPKWVWDPITWSSSSAFPEALAGSWVKVAAVRLEPEPIRIAGLPGGFMCLL